MIKPWAELLTNREKYDIITKNGKTSVPTARSVAEREKSNKSVNKKRTAVGNGEAVRFFA